MWPRAQASIQAAAAAFLARHDRLHVLVNAAGVFVKERTLTEDGIGRTLAVNHLAYFLLTNILGGTPERGADTAVWPATAPEAEGVTGRMFHKRKGMKTPGQGADPAARKRLWDERARLVKLA